MTAEMEEPIVEAFTSAWDDRDPEAVAALFAEGGTYVDPHLGTEVTGEAISEYVAEMREGFPDFRFEWHRSVADDGVAAIEWTIHGTHTGTFGKLPPTGNSASVSGSSIIAFTDEGITRQRDYWDRQAFTQQLGLTFPEILRQLPTLAWGLLRRRA